MKTYKIINIIHMKNTLVLEDPDNFSIQYYKLHSSDSTSKYKIGTKLSI